MNFKSHFFDVIKRSMLQIQYIESVQIPFSDMLLYLQLDAKINWRQFQNTFFQLGLVGDKATCQKKIFQSKNSNRSKQIAEKLNK